MQLWLLKQGRCVGCGKNLPVSDGKGQNQVVCQCGRIYVYEASKKSYRRALITEIKKNV